MSRRRRSFVPTQPAPPLNMPRWGRRLTDADVDAIIASLLSLPPRRSESVPRPTLRQYVRIDIRVFVAHPWYLLAMKCAAMRLGEEFHDVDDVRYLLRHLGISTVDEALAIVSRYFDEKALLPKTRLILEELLPPRS